MKRFCSRLTALLLCAVLMLSALSLIACGREIQPQSRIFYDYFDTVSVIYDYTGSSVAEFDALMEDVEAELKICQNFLELCLL